MTTYLIDYITRNGVRTYKEINARNEYEAKSNLYELEGTFITIISINTWEEYNAFTMLFN